MSDDPEQEPQVLDANAWIASREDREKGMGILAPRDDDEMDAREAYITVLAGRAPDIDASLRVAYALRMCRALIEHKKFDASDLHAVSWKLHHASSLKGWRAKQIEEMAKMAPKPPARRTLVDLVLGRH